MNENEFVSKLVEDFAKIPSAAKSSAFIYDQIMGFYHAVSWSKDLWLFALFGLHILYFFLILFARKFYWLQVFLFLYGCVSIRLAEHANSMLNEHWREFSTQNYFDKHGVFFSTVFSAPLLCLLLMQLLLTLKDVSHLVVVVKRKELGLDQKRKKKEE